MNDSEHEHHLTDTSRTRSGPGVLPAAALISLPSSPAVAGTTTPTPARTTSPRNFTASTVEDPYRWLEDDGAAEVLEWVDAQNEVAFAHLRSLPGARGASDAPA